MYHYFVRAEFADDAVASEFLEWLRDGHAAAVVAAGAEAAEIIIVEKEDASAPAVIECRYRFASKDDFLRYREGPAVALRADGRARFTADRGVTFTRWCGEVSLRFPA